MSGPPRGMAYLPIANQFTEANVETAMCLWEALLEIRDSDTAARAWFEAEGTVSMRHVVISWVPECEAKWEADEAAGTPLVPYDWEHCPDFVRRKLTERAA